MEPRLMSERMLHKVLGWIGVGVVATAAGDGGRAAERHGLQQTPALAVGFSPHRP